MKKQTYILLVLTSFLLSCENSLTPDLGVYQPKLVVNAEIQDGKPIYMHVSTSIGIGSDDEFVHPNNTTDFVGKIVVDGNVDEVEFLDWNNKEEEDGEGEIWRTRRQFLSQVGQHYEFTGELVSDENVISVSASTYLPSPISISNLEYLGEVDVNNSNTHAYNVSFNIDNPTNKGYYHIIVLNNGKPLAVSSFDGNSNAVEKPFHHKGFLLNESRMDNNKVSFAVESGLDLSELTIEVRTCTKSYYDYHVSLSRVYASQNSPYNEPTILYTNVNDGLGIFTAFAKSEYILTF